ncbi:MAG: T9SS type A sorting domain-containing protein, partial [Bacteroidia bacterium]|nr:T9SS type A sorting domain-containing protein [Bacteroidia bacterium]
LSVELFKSDMTSIGYYNPSSTLNVAIDTILTPGTYYILVDGVGNNNIPEYGSLGSYSIVAQESPVVILPLRRLELHGSLIGDKHQFDWIIDADEKVTDQVLEISTDGRNFIPLTQASGNIRTYNYKPDFTITVQYRLKVTFESERQYYSNSVTLHGSGSSERPRLLSNFINTSNIAVNSPGNYSYAIYDFTGKTMLKGQLTNGINNITASAMSPGVYMIRFVNGSEQWTDKLVRQ